jgi:hypothetical protein
VNVYKWVIVAVQCFGALSTVSVIGKPREPMKPGVAVATLIVTAALVFCVVRA